MKPETNLTEARKMAARLKAYWLSKGKKVSVWVEPYRVREGRRTVTYYEIKSDLGDG